MMKRIRALTITLTFFLSTTAVAEPAADPEPEVVSIQNVEFEVSSSGGAWLSLGSDLSPHFLKSVSIKYKIKEGASSVNANENALRDAVKRAAEERCRQIGAADRPVELGANIILNQNSSISAQQITISNSEFKGNFSCAVHLER